MELLLAVIMGYCLAKSDSLHRKAQEYWNEFHAGFNAGMKNNKQKEEA